MDEDFEAVSTRVQVDVAGFRRDISSMRGALEDELGSGANNAGRGIENALKRAARQGRIEFEDLAAAAAKGLADIAAAALKTDGAGGSAGLATALGSMATGLLGLPGRATGGPVSPGRAYVVGERGPELFVPTSSGRVEATPASARAPVNVTVNVTAGGGGGQEFMGMTGRQVARQVRRALERAGR